MPKRIHLIAALFVFGWLSLDIAVQSVETVTLLRHSSTSGWLANWKGDVIRISQVRPGSPAERWLRRGDELVAVNGRGFSQGIDSRLIFNGVVPGTEYRLLLRREGRLVELRLQTLPFGASFTTFILVALLPLAALFLSAGMAVLALKPHDPHAFLLAMMFALFAGGLCQPHWVGRTSAWEFVIVGTSLVLSNFFWPVLLHFFLVFPLRSPVLKRFPTLEYRLYWPVLAALPVSAEAMILFVKDQTWQLAWASQPLLQWLGFVLTQGYVLLGLFSLVLNYRQASLASRRKLTVVVVGSLAAFLPLGVVVLVELFGDVTALPLWVARGLFLGVILGMPLLPLSFIYAIIRHQVIPVRLLIRRGVRYLLVSRGFYLVEGLAVLTTIALLLTGERAAYLDRLGKRADVIATIAVGGAVFLLLQLLNRRLMPAIDRRFLREAYDSQSILTEIGTAARNLPSIEELIALAMGRVEAAFHPESLAVFLQQPGTGDYQSVLPAGGFLSAEAPLIRQLKAVPRPPRESELGGISLAIVAKQDLLGVITLGPRRGDLPYSGEDRRLLEAIAWQLAFAIENSHLVRRRAEEELLKREIQMASEVQRRLFPDRPPESSHLELAGVCRPALAVGGDYYDFLRLGGGRLGIAVADVAGKGISAALLMSVVQASLRSQAGSVAPGQLVAAMNGLLYRSAERNRFASFFYAEFDEDNGQLVYVNAGHNPPLLFRGGGPPGDGQHAPLQAARWRASEGDGAVAVAPEVAAALRLSTGGLVIGALQRTTYEECQIQLHPGDVLVAYTDGVTEAFSPQGEEFGEERLEEVLLAASGQPAEAILEAVVQAVDDFAEGAHQHDDMTMVVAKVR